MENLNRAPDHSSFVSLVEHQSRTPASFYSGPPVLHYYSDRSKLIILDSELPNAPVLAELVAKAPSPPQPQNSNTNDTEDPSNGDNVSAGSKKVIEDVDIWVTSDKLLLYSKSLDSGLSIAYPTISLHAIQSLPTPSAADTFGQGLYMQLLASPTAGNNSNDADNDDEPDSISLTLIPTASAPPVPPSAATEENADAAIDTEDQEELTPVQALFNALSTCSNLHPDPANNDDEDDGEGDAMEGIQGSLLFQRGMIMPGATGGSGGDLPPPMLGSGGWITAENMHEFVDENGNWINDDDDDDDDDDAEGEELGPGAGNVHGRDDDKAEGTNGHGEFSGSEDTKWRRTG